MAKPKTANVALARLAQNREAERLGAAFGRHDLGEISKGDATRFAKVVAALGFAGALTRLEAK